MTADTVPAATFSGVPADSPPSYAESGTPDPARLAQRSVASASLPGVDLDSYRIPQSKLSEGQETITTQLLDPNAQALVNLISKQANLPPKPTIRITGKHKKNDYYTMVDDFDIQLNVMPLLIRPEGERWDYVKLTRPRHMSTIPGPASASSADRKSANNTTGLDEYAKAFVSDEAALKTFTFTREVANWDTDFISGQIHGLLARLQYKGVLTVAFPIQHSKVIVRAEGSTQNPQKSKGGFFENLFGKLSMAPAKDYPVVQAVWPYASSASEEDGRKYAVQSEQAWWNAWKGAIQNAVLCKKTGWISAEDQLEAAMGFEAEVPKAGWGEHHSY